MSTETALSQARDLLESGKSFVGTGMPAEILESWTRCRQLGLDPCGSPEDAALSRAEFAQHREASGRLMRIVRPELELLATQIPGANFMCAFADGNGVVLDAIMDSEFADSRCARAVRPGSVWSEDLRGTNALGLALHTRQTSVVTTGQHYFRCHRQVSCVSAPVFAPDGTFAGLLDSSSEVAERQVHVAALVSLAATSVENRLFAESFAEMLVVQVHPRAEYLPTQSAALIAVDAEGRIAGANRAAHRLLRGPGPLILCRIDEIFAEPPGALLRTLLSGDMARVTDRSGSGFFARMHGAAPVSAAGRKARRVRAVAADRRRAGALVWDDELIRDSLRVAVKAAGLGQPLLIRGGRGSGRTSFAKTVHDRLPSPGALIVLECRDLQKAEAQAEEALARAEADPAATLLLEDIHVLEGRSEAARLRGLLSGTAETAGHRVIATDAGSSEETGRRTVERAGIGMLAVDLPDLSARTDLGKIARAMLSEMSPDHRLSRKAVLALAEIDRPGNLTDLRQHLKLIAATCPGGIVRDTQVRRLFPQTDAPVTACPRCAGSPIREQRCLEIRRMWERCQGNVALTARRLGIARNTVYAHVRDGAGD